MTCPRCARSLEASDTYGPCTRCRSELRTWSTTWTPIRRLVHWLTRTPIPTPASLARRALTDPLETP